MRSYQRWELWSLREVFSGLLRVICHVIQESFITALSHFQWLYSESAAEKLNGIEVFLQYTFSQMKNMLHSWASDETFYHQINVPLDRSVLPSKKEDGYSMFFTFNILWNYQSGFRHTELKKPIVWSRIEKYFVNGSARPLTLPSTLNHGDSSLILFFSDSHLVCHPHCPVVVLFPAFCASVALLQAPCSYGKHWCVEPCGASWDVCRYSQ